MTRRRLLFVGILLCAFAVRLMALQWNWFMHGDVIDDAVVAASVHRDGGLFAYGGADTADPSYFPLPPAQQMETLKQHGPLWPMMGAALTFLYGGESTVYHGFLSLRILSLLAGMLLIALSYVLASRLLDTTAGLAAAAWMSASYVLIDFSGNGAFYGFQGVVYLLWILTAMMPPSSRRAVLLGVITGAGYLANFQCVILVPAGIIVLLFDKKNGRHFLLHAALLLGTAGLIVSPWLIRSHMIFGDPLYSHAWNMRYVHGKMGWDIPKDGVLTPTMQQQLQIMKSALLSWLPNNLYYAARKLFILAPVAFIFFSFGLIDVLFSRKRFTALFPLLLVFVLHMLLSAGWPIWKFRYFVPLLPLVFILSLEEMWHLPRMARWRSVWIGATLAAIVAVSVMTYRVTPVRTTYYDGALTQDPFRGSEEIRYLESYGILPPSHAQ